MGFLASMFGGGRPKTMPTAVSGLQLQSSAQGLPIPLVFGTTKVAPNLIWYGDFESIAQQSSAGAGGKGGVGGGGGGKGGGGSTQYIYQAAFQFGICDGPIIGVGDVYVNKQITTLSDLGYSLFLGDYSQTAWGYLTTNHPSQALNYRGTAYIANPSYQMGNSPQIPNHNIEIKARYSDSVAQEVFGEKNPIPTSGPYTITVQFAAQFTSNVSVLDEAGTLYTAVGGAPSAGQYSVSAGVYTFNSANAGVNVFINYNASAGPDADPSLVINFLLTDSRSGAGFPSARLASLATYQAYCVATGLLISPAYMQQSTAASILSDLEKATNSAFVFSSGMLSLVPFGDQTITANGFTYTAPTVPLYDLGDDDFIRVPADDPVKLDRSDTADAYNSIQLECLDRAHQYNPAVVTAKDQAAIDTFGLRETTITAHYFANLNAGRLSAQLQLQRQQVRNKYNYTLDHRYVLLDVMDIVTITDAKLGLNKQWVRILTIDEDEDGNFAMVVEEYLKGNGSAPAYNFQYGGGYNADYNSPSGNANAPVLFEPPIIIAQTGGLEVDIAVSGNANWGGADVWISTDGNTYKQAGRVTGPARQGVSTAIFPSGSDPDTTNILSVNLSESFGELISGTADDADLAHTLCYIDGELISFQTALLTSTYHYDLKTYLRRGLYGTPISSHASGSQFARLDGGIFAYPYDKTQIGLTIYIKLLSFNIFGGGAQAIADVSPYPYTIVGPPVPEDVTNFGAQQNGNVVVFSWTKIPQDFALKGYDIGYAPQGTTDWNLFTLLTEAARGTEMTNAAVPPGTWTFGIRARDIADQLSVNAAFVDLTVINENIEIYEIAEETGWLGTLVNLYLHWTGILIPIGTLTSDQYSAISPPSAPTLGTTAGGALAAVTYYAKVTYTTVSGETLASSESSQAVLINNLLVVTSPSTVAGASGYNVYVSTSTGTETKQNASPIALGTNWTEPTGGLIAGSALPSQNTTGWEVFDVFVPDPVSSASYTSPIIDTGFDDTLRVFSTIAATDGPGETGTPTPSLAIDTWLTAGSDTGVYTPWVIGTILMRYLKARAVLSSIVQGSVYYISSFVPTIDRTPEEQHAGGVTVAPGGTLIIFPTPFHIAPFVQATAVATTSLNVTASNITATGFTAQVFNSAGSDVGGVINWSATGE